MMNTKNMRPPPEFNSWDEVWAEHQRLGKNVIGLEAALRALAEEVAACRYCPSYWYQEQLATARRATDANPTARAAVDAARKAIA